METESDEALLSRLPSDEGALEALYGRWGPRLAHLYSLLGIPSPDVPDLLQTVFLELWRTSPRFDPDRGTAKAWIFRLARRRGLDHIRMLRRHPVPVEEVRGPGDAPESNWVDRLAVEEAVEVLSEREQALIRLAYYGGFTQQEIAEAWGVPLGTVKAWAYRALRKLERRMAAGDGVRP